MYEKEERIDPCGTPLDTYAGSENIFLNLTKKVLFVSEDQNQSTKCLQKSKSCNFCSKVSWSILSKAICKPIRIMPFIKTCLKPFYNFVIKNGEEEVSGMTFANTKLINI